MKVKNVIKSSHSSILILLLILFYGLAYNLPQYFYIFAINDLAQGNFIQFVDWQFLQFVIGVLAAVLLGLNTVLFEKLIQKHLKKLRSKILRNYYASDEDDLSGIENTLVNNLNMVKRNGADRFFQLLNQVSVMVFSLLFISTINFNYLFIVVILAGGALFVPKIMDKTLNLATKKVSSTNQKFLETIASWIDGLYELTTFNAFKIFSQKIGRSSSNLEHATVQNQKVMNASLFLNGLANAFCQIVIMGLGGYLFFSRRISLGSWAAANDFSFAIFSSGLAITNLINQIRSVFDVNKDIAEKLEQRVPVASDHDTALPVAVMTHDLSYHYADKKIDYPDISVKQGEKILLVGPSGVGKTTLFKLILGKLKADTGNVTFLDGEGHVVEPDLRKIGYIPQKANLFPDSIGNNITMFDDDLKPKLSKITKKVILDLDPDLILKPDGANISGGEQQKIVLARHEIHQSRLVLIDEGLSAVDRQTVPRLLAKLTADDDSTLIMIAHNLNDDLKKYFDRVIVLKQLKR